MSWNGDETENRPIRLALTQSDREKGITERWGMERVPKVYTRDEVHTIVINERGAERKRILGVLELVMVCSPWQYAEETVEQIRRELEKLEEETDG